MICIISQRTRTLSRVLVALSLINLIGSTAQAEISVNDIDRIRKLSILNDDHARMITDFVNEQFDAMTEVKNSSNLSQPVLDLVNSVSSNVNRREVKLAYSNQFTSAVKAAYKRIFQESDLPGNNELVERIKLSAAVVLANCDNIIIIEDLLVLLRDKSPEIRYWAAKGLAMPEIQRYMISDEPAAQTSRQNILSALSNCLKNETSVFVISQIAAAAPVDPDGAKLLQQCTAKRVTEYLSWQVSNELVDTIILQKIFDIIVRGQLENPGNIHTELVRGVVELFSVAYQRYTKTMNYIDSNGLEIALLSETNQQELSTMLIMSEAGLLTISQSERRPRFPSLLQKKRWQELEISYNSVIKVNGAVDSRFNLYPEGEKEPILPRLSDPPAKFVERAKILKEIKEKTIGKQ